MDGVETSLRASALNLPEGGLLPEHDHRWDQLAYAVQGVMAVETEQGRWVVPPHRAVWLPASVPHRIRAGGPLAMRNVYFPPDTVRALPRRCCVVGVPPLLRELILDLIGRPLPLGNTRAHVEALLVELLAELDQEPLILPMPRDPRARRLAEHLAAHPDDRRPLDVLAREVGASPRTLQRAFLSQAGLSFRQWRQQMRLHRALVLLAEGTAVTAVASRVGYESPSAFVAMFRTLLGTTPGRYFNRR
ncbi:MAG TPA: AraC family transcriptional regulator [Acidobacteria bacterium]|nr:AraC family transcriptional regulator [Acidobacteriota bacterium]